MNILTMVLRSGTKGMSANDMGYTFIANDYSVIRMGGKEVIEAMRRREYDFTNMGISEKGLIATNGAMDKYTMIDPVTGVMETPARPVVLNRVEVDDKLTGYTIFNVDGILQEVNVKQAVMIHNNTPFSNGKIRGTQKGDIISSIVGNYPLRKIKVPKEVSDKLEMDISIVFIGSAIGKESGVVKYGGILIEYNNAADISGIYNKLVKGNNEVIERVARMGGGSRVRSILGIKRTSKAGFYGVFPIENVFELIKKSGGVKSKLKGIMIATLDYTNGEEESRVVLNNDLKIIDKVQGTDKSDKVLDGYVAEVIQELKKLMA